MQIRTDLAVELQENLGKQPLRGIFSRETHVDGFAVHEIRITDKEGEKQLGRPQGSYFTLCLPPLAQTDPLLSEAAAEALAELLRRLLPEKGRCFLVAGLGNRDITPDALGPLCVRGVLATRHLDAGTRENIGLTGVRSVAAIAPGVLGQTGAETGEILHALTAQLQPDAVLVVDALAARSPSRLGCTVQLADSGIVPGAGVKNDRQALSRDTLGVPVISLGIPTVIDAASLIEAENEELAALFVTPRDVDAMVRRGADILALAINLALHPVLGPQEILMLTR